MPKLRQYHIPAGEMVAIGVVTRGFVSVMISSCILGEAIMAVVEMLGACIVSGRSDSVLKTSVLKVTAAPGLATITSTKSLIQTSSLIGFASPRKLTRRIGRRPASRRHLLLRHRDNRLETTWDQDVRRNTQLIFGAGRLNGVAFKALLNLPWLRQN